MENPNKTIDDIIRKMKLNRRKTNTALILKAYNFAEEHHRGQKRMSGEDYIIHPLMSQIADISLIKFANLQFSEVLNIAKLQST